MLVEKYVPDDVKHVLDKIKITSLTISNGEKNPDTDWNSKSVNTEMSVQLGDLTSTDYKIARAILSAESYMENNLHMFINGILDAQSYYNRNEIVADRLNRVIKALLDKENK